MENCEQSKSTDGKFIIVCWSRSRGPIFSNHRNLYVKLLALVLGRYVVPRAKVKGTE